MIDHILFYSSDYEKAISFYDAVLPALGHTRLFQMSDADSRKSGYGKSSPQVWIAEGETGSARLHIAFRADSEDAVKKFYENALAAGGSDNGKPGYRPEYYAGYFAAFVTDTDGHNIEAVFHAPLFPH
ncbi:VOC family protein [Pectobacterium carotovorum]|nr:VOC family protein [Pectobacterium carotovorum]